MCEQRSRILQTNPCRAADVTDGCCFWSAERSQRGSLALRAWCAAGASSQLAIRGSREQVDHYGSCQCERMRIQRPNNAQGQILSSSLLHEKHLFLFGYTASMRPVLIIAPQERSSAGLLCCCSPRHCASADSTEASGIWNGIGQKTPNATFMSRSPH